MADVHFEALKLKYRPVFDFMHENGVRVDAVDYATGKLRIRATAPTLELEARVWDEIKAVDPSYSDLDAEIKSAEKLKVQTASSGGASGTDELYTVQPDDSLRSIAESYYGDPDLFTRIYEANRERMKDPDDLRPGQRLVIPIE